MASVRSAAPPRDPIHALIGSVPISGSLKSTPQPASTSPAPRWHRLDHDERRRQILACAKRLFSERNYASVSTSEIASEAGVARGLLHHYFGTKRELYLEVVRGMMRMPSNPVPLQAPGGGHRDVIDESVDRWLTMLERNRGHVAGGDRRPGRRPRPRGRGDPRPGPRAGRRPADRGPRDLRGSAGAAELRALIRAYSRLRRGGERRVARARTPDPRADRSAARPGLSQHRQRRAPGRAEHHKETDNEQTRPT